MEDVITEVNGKKVFYRDCVKNNFKNYIHYRPSEKIVIEILYDKVSLAPAIMLG